MRIFVATSPLDFRKGMDSTAALCRRVLDLDPLGGAVFVFSNRQRTMVRVMVYDGNGLWLATKRLSSGRFPAWTALIGLDGSHHAIQAHQLQLLLAGGDWSRAPALTPWRAIAA
jgi:transposase